MSERIPVEVPFHRPSVDQGEVEAVVDSLRGGWLTTGPNARAFELEFEQFLGGGVEAVAVNSATAAMHLLLEAIGIGPGDQVIVPTWTFTATAEVVRYLGADPVFVDIDPETFHLDLRAAEAVVTPRTRAIMPVHFAGLAMESGPIDEFASKYGLAVVDDAAHALPSSDRMGMVGASGFMGTAFSFYATKTITTGEGGMITTRDKGIADRARKMRLHGIDRDVFDRYTNLRGNWHYDVVAPGYKYNLPDPAAAMGRVQLRRAIELSDGRAAIARQYSASLQGVSADLPPPPPIGSRHAWHLFVLRIHDDARIGRDEFIAEMANAGIGCSVHFTPLHRLTYWRDQYGLNSGDYPVAERLADRTVSLPLFPGMNQDQVDRVVSQTRRLLC
jgi:dTDP-4-amino-4,6-dideoxygalactose transaminase